MYPSSAVADDKKKGWPVNDASPLAVGVAIGMIALGPVLAQIQLPDVDNRVLSWLAIVSVVGGALVQGGIWAYRQITGAIREGQLADAKAFEGTWKERHEEEAIEHAKTKGELVQVRYEMEKLRAAYTLLVEKSGQSWPAINRPQADSGQP